MDLRALCFGPNTIFKKQNTFAEELKTDRVFLQTQTSGVNLECLSMLSARNTQRFSKSVTGGRILVKCTFTPKLSQTGMNWRRRSIWSFAQKIWAWKSASRWKFEWTKMEKNSLVATTKARGFMTVNGSRDIMKRTEPRRGQCRCSAGTSKKSSKQPSKNTDISNGNQFTRWTSELLSK